MKAKLLNRGGYEGVPESAVGGIYKVFRIHQDQDLAQDEYIVEIPGVKGGIFSSKGKMFLAEELEILEE